MMAHVRAVLLDIEGTTTPVDFVYQTLFPFARRHLREFLSRNSGVAPVQSDITLLREEHARDVSSSEVPPPWSGESIESAVEYALWLMDRDRKSTALKSIQGKIWQQGYESGELQGVVYEDVPVAFGRWQDEGRKIAIYSSGSVLAQKLIFAHTNAGDLTPFISAYFDTTTGGKKESASYREIARVIGCDASGIIFYSDSLVEVNAAREAGMLTALVVRHGHAHETDGQRTVRDFLGE